MAKEVMAEDFPEIKKTKRDINPYIGESFHHTLSTINKEKVHTSFTSVKLHNIKDQGRVGE